jgi:hypothetical protein
MQRRHDRLINTPKKLSQYIVRVQYFRISPGTRHTYGFLCAVPIDYWRPLEQQFPEKYLIIAHHKKYSCKLYLTHTSTFMYVYKISYNLFGASYIYLLSALLAFWAP